MDIIKGKCSYCGIESKGLKYLFDRKQTGHGFCKECILLMGKCSCCQKVIVKDDTHSYREWRSREYYCPTCFQETFSQCDSCGDFYPTDRMCEAYGEIYCDGCFHENYFYCDDCGTVGYLDNSYSDEDYGNVLCENCYYENENGRNIMAYEYKPRPIFHYLKHGKNRSSKTIPNAMCFGIENEVECPGGDRQEAAANIMNKHGEILYLKYDSTISHGFEMVYHPISFQYFKKNIKQFENILKHAKENGCDSNNYTCGLHVHIDKIFWTTLQLYKLVSLMMKNPDFFFRISQRRSWTEITQNARFTPHLRYDRDFHHNINARDSILNKNAGTRKKSDRYKNHAINFAIQKDCGGHNYAINCENSNTIEFRMFKSTLNINSFAKNIEFIDSIFMFTKDITLKKMKVSEYKKFVRDRKNLYGHLDKFLHTPKHKRTLFKEQV